jgi:hypothetical protein
MNLNIILSIVHIILSSVILFVVINGQKLESINIFGYKVDPLISFLIISIIACVLILIFSVDCRFSVQM